LVSKANKRCVSLGKVRTEMVKRISLELLDKYPYSFEPEFEPNKQFLNEIGLDVSKKLRNRIAGYITTVVKSDLMAQAMEEAEEAAQEIL
jgi:small subunit ribosomal protein S17e